MPNLWSRTNRKIYEAFKGPRTVDDEFNKKILTVKDEEKYLDHLDLIMTRIRESREMYKQHLTDINHFLINLYDANSYYWPYMNDIINTHKELEKLNENYLENISRITNISEDLSKKLTQIDENIKERERLRFIHDHYDEKIERYITEHDKRLKISNQENSEFMKRFQRNEKKYKLAADNYVEQSLRTYKMVDEYINMKPYYINPIISQLVAEEIRFYNESSNLMMKLDSISERFKAADASRPKIINEDYDPVKYLRGQKLLLCKSVVSEHILPSEENIIIKSQDIPIHDTQEIVVNNTIQTPIIDNKIFIRENLNEINQYHNGAQIELKDVNENIIPIETDKTGVLNVQSLYIPQNNEVNLINYQNQKINERLHSEENESNISEINNFQYLVDQHLNDGYKSQPEIRYEHFNSTESPVLQEPVYTYRTIDRESVMVPESHNVELGKNSKIENSIRNDVNSSLIRNGDFYTKEYIHRPSQVDDQVKVKAIESDDKIKLVYDLAPLIKTYIKDSSIQGIQESTNELKADQNNSQNLAKKMTGVSEEFEYNNPNSSERFIVRVSLKNKKSIDQS